MIRNVREKLNVVVRPEDLEPYYVVPFDYPDRTVRMHMFLLRSDALYTELLERDSCKWHLPRELPSVDWASADKVVADALIRDLESGKI